MKTEYKQHQGMYHGIIEDIDDPLKLHRLRVRVIEVHDDDKQRIPTTTLPWFQPLFAVNNSDKASAPKLGDWVLVYFPDPDSAQFGYVMGVIPGIVSEEEVPELVVTAKRPVKPAGDPAGNKGYPSTAPTGRSVVTGTGVDRTNKKLIHVCDITHETDRVVNAVTRQFSEVVAAIKQAIATLLKSLGATDRSVEVLKLTEIAKNIAREIKKVVKFIKDINETIAGYLRIVAQIKAMITYILNLPAKLLAEFQQCLANLYKSLLAGFTSGFAEIGLVSDIQELATAINEVGTEIAEVAKQGAILASTPQQLGAVLVAPSSAADIKASETAFTNYMASPTSYSSLVPSTSSLTASTEATAISNANITDPTNAKLA